MHLIERWHHGWVKADGLTSTRDGNTLVVRVGRSRRQAEWIALDDNDAQRLAEIISGLTEPTWLTVPTHDPETVVKAVKQGGLTLARPPETFMRRSLADHPAPPAPDGYSVAVTRGDVIEVRVLADGAEAASGLMAVVGTDAVAHRIETSPEHRRRGLGSVVMGALVREAVRDGASTGLLLASEDGLHLYRKLGWERVSDIIVAHNELPERS